MRATLKSADGKHEFEDVANLARQQVAREVEQSIQERVREAKVEQQKANAVWAASKDNPANAKSTPVVPWWDKLHEVDIFSPQNPRVTSSPPASSVAKVAPLPTLSEREAASKADRKQAKSHIPEPEEPKKRWMKKCS